MGLFDRKPPSRAQLLEKAAKARAKKKRKKAIGLYRQALELDPDDLDVHARLGSLLGQTGQLEEAWGSFKRAAEGYREKGFLDKSVGVYRQAVQHIPQYPPAWHHLADANLERKRTQDARDTLLKGARNFLRRPHYTDAIHLLQRAFDLDPYHYDVTYALAYALKKNGERQEARQLLEVLTKRCRKRRLRQVRGLLFRISPTPASFWRWLRASLAGV